MDPASELLVDAVRYLSLHRKAMGGWGSSYENAWILFSLVEVLKGTGELQGEFTWQASLNSTPIASGEVAGLETMTPITATASIDQMLRNEPNGLTLERSAGPGRLYYRAYLQVDRPVETIPALQRGLTIEREYYPIVQDCRLPDCTTTLEASLGAENPVLLVRLTLTVPKTDITCGKGQHPRRTEIVNTGLLTTRQGETPGELETTTRRSFAGGWGWWIFEQPKIYDDGIEWMAQYLPAGTYQLTYKLLPPRLESSEYYPPAPGNTTSPKWKPAPPDRSLPLHRKRTDYSKSSMRRLSSSIRRIRLSTSDCVAEAGIRPRFCVHVRSQQ
jgi:hypothetical protein